MYHSLDQRDVCNALEEMIQSEIIWGRCGRYGTAAVLVTHLGDRGKADSETREIVEHERVCAFRPTRLRQ